MTTAQFWAAATIVVLAGWTVTLIFLMRALLPMANALKVYSQLNEHIDRQIRQVVERIQGRQGGIPLPKEKRMASEPPETTIDALREVFGGNPIEPISEQPDNELEVTES